MLSSYKLIKSKAFACEEYHFSRTIISPRFILPKKKKLSLEVRYDGERVRVGPRGVLGPAGAAALDEDVVLAGEGDGAERDDEEEVRHVRLHALAVQQVALLRAAIERRFAQNYFNLQGDSSPLRPGLG